MAGRPDRLIGLAELEDAGAHDVVDTLAKLDPVLDDIDARLVSAGR